MKTISLAKWELAVGLAFPMASIAVQDDQTPIPGDPMTGTPAPIEVDWDQHQSDAGVLCEFRPRSEFRGCTTKPGIMEKTGTRLTLRSLCLMDFDEAYPGEFALTTIGSCDSMLEDLGVEWVASGDVVALSIVNPSIAVQDDQTPIPGDLKCDVGDYVALLGDNTPTEVVAVFSPSKAMARVGAEHYTAVPDVVFGVRTVNVNMRRLFVKTGDGGYTFRTELDLETLTPSERAEYFAEPDPWPYGYENGPAYPNPVFRSAKIAVRYAKLADEAEAIQNEMVAFNSPSECSVRLFDRIELEQERLTDLFSLNV